MQSSKITIKERSIDVCGAWTTIGITMDTNCFLYKIY